MVFTISYLFPFPNAVLCKSNISLCTDKNKLPSFFQGRGISKEATMVDTIWQRDALKEMLASN